LGKGMSLFTSGLVEDNNSYSVPHSSRMHGSLITLAREQPHSGKVYPR